jgi:hypothetical protein
MRTLLFLLCSVFLTAATLAPAQAQPDSAQPRIVWEVKNRFRLFREERDFLLHVEAQQGRNIFEAENALALQSDGRGWARNMVGRLCIDRTGAVPDQCTRDGIAESYLAPALHRIGARLTGADGNCSWSFDDGQTDSVTVPCGEEVRLGIRSGRPTLASVEVTRPDGTITHLTENIVVDDFLVAGLGDSIASGEGNPDRAVALADTGFCYRRFLGNGGSYFRPSRAGFSGDRSCEVRPDLGDGTAWAKHGAQWMNAACHRSLYSYQLRTALALATENPHIAVTYLPLACTGASIENGLLGSQRASEINCGKANCSATVPAQIELLRGLLERAKKQDPTRKLDLVLLTVGANDIGFSGLVADAMIEASTERVLASRTGVIQTIDSAATALDQKLPKEFTRLRAALKPLVDGDLSRVLYVAYGHPALAAPGTPCPGGRDGFDVHPAFGIDADRLARVAAFVQDRFLPRLKSLASCESAGCRNRADSMSFVDGHQAAFAQHGFCARSDADPAFDRACFSNDGNSFTDDLVAGADNPLACGRSASEFRAYAPRARWIRTANDSYFAAMTFPQNSSTMQPADIHDAAWGILSAVYGGAVHPTAEGHAAMADAALPAARAILHLDRPAQITAEPLAPPSPQ